MAQPSTWNFYLSSSASNKTCSCINIASFSSYTAQYLLCASPINPALETEITFIDGPNPFIRSTSTSNPRKPNLPTIPSRPIMNETKRYYYKAGYAIATHQTIASIHAAHQEHLRGSHQLHQARQRARCVGGGSPFGVPTIDGQQQQASSYQQNQLRRTSTMMYRK